MALRDFSRPGSWSSRLYNILRPAPHPMAIQFGNSQSSFRHSTGEIWRHVLSCSVYHDLAGEKETNQQTLRTNQGIARGRTWRRFVRMECIGLSGLLFYEIRTPLSSGSTSESVDDRSIPLIGNNMLVDNLTLEGVFGDPDDPDDSGMAVDDLLDAVHVRVVYFPAYACTSFIIGQAMTAFFRDQPSFRPRPAPGGFTVPASETMEIIKVSSKVECLPAKNSPKVSCAEAEPALLASYSWQAICGDLGVLDKLAMEPDDPYSALCVRSSHRPDRTVISSHGLSDEEEGNTTSSTIESVGPSTPPPPGTTRSVAPGNVFSLTCHPFSGSLPVPAEDKSIGFNVWTLKPSRTFPIVSSKGDTLVSAHSEQDSFLDCSLSYVEIYKEN